MYRSVFPPWSGRAGRILQNQLRVGYTTESDVGVPPGGATTVNDLAGCGRQPSGPLDEFPPRATTVSLVAGSSRPSFGL